MLTRRVRPQTALVFSRAKRCATTIKSENAEPLQASRESPVEDLKIRPDWDRGGKTKANALTPLLSSMRKLMDDNRGCVCLIQVGSFYELYFEHATLIGPKLGIKVAVRKTSNHTVPMAGFPLSQLQKFVKIIVHDLQCNVAIIDQFDGIKTDTDLKHRKVSRIVSPGTLVDESFMNYSKNNYLVAVSLNPKVALPPDLDTPVGLSWIDISVGELFVQQTNLGELAGDLRRISPSEVILPKDFQPADGASNWLSELGDLKRYFVRYHKTAYGDYKARFEASVLTSRKVVEGLSVREEAAMNLVLSYVNVNLPDRQLSLDPPTRYVNSKYLSMDSRTRDALELTGRATFGSVSVVGTLLNTIKRTTTTSGTRLLTQWIKSPILDEIELKLRHDFVQLFKENPVLRLQIRNQLSSVGDFVRSLQKLSLKSGAPVLQLRDIAYGLDSLHELRTTLDSARGSLDPQHAKLLDVFLETFVPPISVAESIKDTILIDEYENSRVDAKVPQNAKTANLEDQLVATSMLTGADEYSNVETMAVAESSHTFSIKKDHNPELRTLHEKLIKADSEEERILSSVEEIAKSVDVKAVVSKKEQFGRSLIAINSRQKFLGPVCDAISQNLDVEIRDKRKGSALIRTDAWSEIVEQRESTLTNIAVLENQILDKLRKETLDEVYTIRSSSRQADFLDITSSFGQLAQENNWVRPKFVSTNNLKIKEGRHAVVESSLKDSGQLFMPNDTSLGKDGLLWVISGPNMGGKSTFLRQNALIVILAQIGSFVPAASASLAVVDRLFTRIGASDDIFSDLSTFMVEMVETSNILTHATNRSLAIVDEIGRGTSGKEGLAIAYATLVSLLTKNRCRSLFATHFGAELKHLLDVDKVDQRNVRFYRTKVARTEMDGTLSFDHALEEGISEKSYALDVARLAGFPKASLEHARRALDILAKA